MNNPSLSISHEDIAERAHEIWDQEGRPLGHELEHWLRAEQELHNELPFLDDASLSNKTELSKKKSRSR
jgi:Protein of unknown function (DUF2934)